MPVDEAKLNAFVGKMVGDLGAAMFRDEPKITAAFRTGKGVGRDEHDACLLCGTERFFRPGYAANLVASWLPALDGVEAKLERGARVADVGCGHGASTIVIAKAFPNARFYGFDYHAPSIERAKQAAAEAGVADHTEFAVAPAKTFPGSGYDLVAFFDCLHDMGDPVGAARHVRDALANDGTWMIVEPFAHDRVEDNLNPVGRLYYAGFDDDLHAGFAQPGGRSWSRRASRRGAAARGGHRGRLDAVSPRHRDAVQPGLRGAALSDRSDEGSSRAADAVLFGAHGERSMAQTGGWGGRLTPSVNYRRSPTLLGP